MALVIIIISVTTAAATVAATSLSACSERTDITEHSCAFHLEKWQHFPSTLGVETMLLPVGQRPAM